MTLDAFWMTARRRSIWLVALMGAFVAVAIFFYASLSDVYVIRGVITSKTSEDRSFDAGSLGGLAALAGGGQRPVFEQMAFLLQSEAVIRRVLPELRRSSPKLVDELLARSKFQQFRAGLENSARATFDKPQKHIAADDQLVDAVRSRLKISKTPEGYIQITFTSGTAAGQVQLIQGLLREADDAVRTRERVDYRNRVDTYQDLIPLRTRPTEQMVLATLIGREYANFVTAQSGKTFSFSYIETPLAPERLYSTSLLTLLILSAVLSLILFSFIIIILIWIE